MMKKTMLSIACTVIFNALLNAADQKPTLRISGSGSLPVTHELTIKAEALTQAAQALKEIKLDIKPVTFNVDAKALTDAAHALKEIKLDVKPEVNVKAADLVAAAKAMALNAKLDHQLQVNAPEHPTLVKIDIPTQDIKDATNHICDRTEELLIKSATCTFAWSLSHSISNPCCLLCGLGGVAYILITPVNTLKKTPAYLMEQLNRCRSLKPRHDRVN